jgi:hypothetical protein
MKKKKLIGLICLLLMILIIGMLVIGRNSKEKPYHDLKIDDIKKVEMLVQPPNKVVEITDRKQLEKFIIILNKIVLYKKDDTWKEYSGQSVQFTITKNNGDIITVWEYNPFIILDGVGYKTKYEPCEELNKFANSLIVN